MERRTEAPRAGWQKTVTEQGMVYDAPGRGPGGAARPYWDESVHYVFAMDEILALEADVELLHSMCLAAVDQWAIAALQSRSQVPQLPAVWRFVESGSGHHRWIGRTLA